MTSDRSVTYWIGQLKAGDGQAAQQLWERYFQRMVRLARRKLQDSSRRVADEEDAALSAFDSFCRGANQGRFPQLSDRDGLWQLLMVITARKAIDQAQHERRRKRGGGAVRGESALIGADGSAADEAGINQVIGREPTPEFAARVAEECRRLLESLGSVEIRSVALLRMEGYSNDEIAVQLGRSRPTIERKLRLIRSLWEKEMPS